MSEEQTLSEEQRSQVLFIQIVTMFHGAAMQQMGKLINPITQKIERDLAQAKVSVDILGMLETKTKGNLSEEEQRFLEHTLFELRMNYLDEMKKPSPPPEEAQEGAEEPEGKEEPQGKEEDEREEKED